MRDVAIEKFRFLDGDAAKRAGRAVERLIEHTISALDKKEWATLSWLLANLVELTDGRWVHYSRDKNYYVVKAQRRGMTKTGRYGQHLNYDGIVKVVRGLIAERLVEHELGTRESERRSRMRPTAKMRVLFEQDASSVAEKPTKTKKRERLVLKTKKNAKKKSFMCDYKDNKTTNSMRSKIALINLVNSRFKWRLEMLLDAILGGVREKGARKGSTEGSSSRPAAPAPSICNTVFSFHSPGCMETLGLGAEKSSVEISSGRAEKRTVFGDERSGSQDAENGSDPLRELDVSCHRVFNDSSFSRGGRFYGPELQSFGKEVRRHITIDHEPTVELDYGSMHPRMLYHLAGLDAPHDVYQIEGLESLRKHLKLFVLISLNAEGRGQALSAFAGALRKAGLTLPPEMSFSDLADRFLLEHKEIAKWFYQDRGKELQNWDAKIAERVMHTFAKDGRPIASVHDSFIVRMQDKDLLRSTMRESYKKIMDGREPIIK